MSGFGCRPFKGIDSSVFPWRVFASTEGSPTSARKKKQPSARGPTGEVRDPPHRLRGASRPAVFQWQLGISPDGVRLGKHWGPGCPRRRFGYFAAEGKVTRAGARNTPKQPARLMKVIRRHPPPPAPGGASPAKTHGAGPGGPAPNQQILSRALPRRGWRRPP